MTLERIVCDIAVAGAGPAGMAAAEAAARAGARVVMVDLFATPGGQYHMQPPQRLAALRASQQAKSGREAAHRCEAAGVRIVTGAEIFWAEPGFRLLAHRQGQAIRIDSSILIAATGASERVLPFKGWTLPGVISAGAAQRLVKTGGTAPGRRIVLAGSGPFLLAVASTFAAAGIRLAAYVEAAKPRLDAARLLARHPDRAGEALKLVTGLLRTKPRRLQGHIVIEALGEDRLEAVRAAPLGPDGAVRVSNAFVIDGIDALCVGFGFRPSVEITSVLKARHSYDEALGGWLCDANATTGATSVPGLYAAGEVTGLGGAVVARLAGLLAGRHAATALGFGAVADSGARKSVRELQKARRFAAGLAALFPFPTGLLDIVSSDTIACRCEDVSVGDIQSAVEQGARDFFSTKMWTRAGMGPCQGRVCGQPIAALLSRTLKVPPSEIGFNSPHLPLRPVPLEIAASALET